MKFWDNVLGVKIKENHCKQTEEDFCFEFTTTYILFSDHDTLVK